MIALVETVIDAREEVGGVKTRRNHACADQRTTVVDGTKTIIDRVDCGRRNSYDRGIVSTSLFEVSEEEGSVAPQRPADRPAILRLRQQILGWRERIASVETLVAEEPIQAAAQSFVPDLVRILTTPPEALPNSAMPPEVTT